MEYVWELHVIGGGGGLWHFGRKPTRLECEQRLHAACGDRYTLRRIPRDGHTIDPIR